MFDIRYLFTTIVFFTSKYPQWMIFCCFLLPHLTYINETSFKLYPSFCLAIGTPKKLLFRLYITILFWYILQSVTLQRHISVIFATITMLYIIEISDTLFSCIKTVNLYFVHNFSCSHIYSSDCLDK